jgi:hypothetical protein
LSAWFCRTGITHSALARKCTDLQPEPPIHRPHISEYASGGSKPTRDKAPVLSAATFALTRERAGEVGDVHANDGLTVEELLYYDGLPDGAVMARAGTSDSLPSEPAASDLDDELDPSEEPGPELETPALGGTNDDLDGADAVA